MAGGGTTAILDTAAVERRARLAGPAGYRGILANKKVFFQALFASIGGLLYGYNQGVFSGVLVMHNFHDHFAATLDNTGLKGMVTAILELGAWLGCLVNSITAERFGRRGAIAFACIFFVIGVIIQTCAKTGKPAYLYCGRFITGFGVGSLSVGVPLLNAELAPAEVRGSLVTLQQLSIEFGILVSFWIDYGTNHIGGTGASQSQAAWRLPLALQLVPCLVLASGIFFLPESPRWLINRGRDTEALEVLAKLRGLPQDAELVQIEHLEVRAERQFDVETSREKFPDLQDGSTASAIKLNLAGYASIISDRTILKMVFAGAATMFFQQWNGINAVLYYAPTIFANLGQTSNEVDLLGTGVVGIVMFVATFPTVAYLDTIGRKAILISGALAMAICHTMLAILSGVYEDSWPQHKVAGWWAVVFVWLYAMAFGFSWGPVAWVYISEIFPLGIRAKAMSVAASSNWMNNFIIGEITPTMLKKMRFGTYILFGALTYGACIFVYFFLPETKGLSLEEVDTLWGGKSRQGEEDLKRLARINEELGLTKIGHAPDVSEDGKDEKLDSPV